MRAGSISRWSSFLSADAPSPESLPAGDGELGLCVLPAISHQRTAMVLSSSVREAVAELLAGGRKILAVKLVREQAGVSLLEAKQIVEELEQMQDVQLRIATARPVGGRRST